MPFCPHPVAAGPSAPAQAAASGGGSSVALGGGLLDAQALARLHELDPRGQSGLVQRVLSTYVQSLQRLLEQMSSARAAGDCAVLRHAAHTLKSSSASVGALALSALCSEVEAQLRPHGRADAVSLAPQLDRLLAEGERILCGLRASWTP